MQLGSPAGLIWRGCFDKDVGWRREGNCRGGPKPDRYSLYVFDLEGTCLDSAGPSP